MDYAYATEPQVHAAGITVFWLRGKVLGGSGSLNGMIYVRGHHADYDNWAYDSAAGWSYDEMAAPDLQPLMSHVPLPVAGYEVFAEGRRRQKRRESQMPNLCGYRLHDGLCPHAQVTLPPASQPCAEASFMIQ